MTRIVIASAHSKIIFDAMNTIFRFGISGFGEFTSLRVDVRGIMVQLFSVPVSHYMVRDVNLIVT
jgi:hypothetical protein